MEPLDLNPQDHDAHAAPTLSPVEVPLRRAPLWSSGLTVLAALAAAYTVSTAANMVPGLWRGTTPSTDSYDFGLVTLFLLILMGLLIGKRWLVRRKPLPPIAFFDKHMVLPSHGEAWRNKALPYDEILAVNEGGRPPKRHFFIESRRHVFHLTQEMFRDADGPERLFFELRRRILSLPQGAVLLEQTERKRLQAVRAMLHRPMWTQAILGVMAVFYLNTYLKGAFDSPFGLVRWGANVPALVRAGEAYRLVAANFLHGGWWDGLVHVSMNAMALYYLGNLTERLYGWPRFVLLFTLTGLAAMGASVVLNDSVMTLGASGTVFGLLGAFAVLSWRLRTQLPLGLRQPMRWWVFMLAVNALVPLLWPMVDIAAHLAGFVSGGLLGAALIGREKKLPEPAGPLLRTAALGMAGLYLGGLGVAVYQAARSGTDSDLRFVQAVVHSPHTSVSALNDLAMIMAVSPQATDEELQAADEAVQTVLKQPSDNPLYFNTSATLKARQKDFDGAVRAGRRALQLAGGDEPLLASQLARFLTLRQRASGGPMLENGLQTQSFALRVDNTTGTMTLERAPEVASDALALLKRGDRVVGLVRIRVGPKAALPAHANSPLLRPNQKDLYHVELALAEASSEPAGEGVADVAVTPVLELTY